MSQTTQHYDNFLAEHYCWMLGVPFEAKVAEQQDLLLDLGVTPGGRAFDLGSGPGYQSFALVDLGYRQVTALDTCGALLAELDERKGGRQVQTVQADMADLADHAAPGSLDLIVCMGDSLSHLSSRVEVEKMIMGARTALDEGGQIVIGYRDLSVARFGSDCTQEIRATEDRVLTCSMDYRPLHVEVHDRLQRRVFGGWMVESSSYAKLRLSADALILMLKDAGFEIERQEDRDGMTMVVARVA